MSPLQELFYDHFGIFGPNHQIGFIRSGLHTAGLVQSVRPSQAAPQVSASPYAFFFTRVTRWIPRLPAERPSPHVVLSLLRVKVVYASSFVSPTGPLWWIPEGVVYLRKSTFALAFLVPSYFVVLTA